ncbi:MAG: hypothetical protein HUU60_11645 [Armatimonadetes bacterium]|nr:hypothetical protein [Armatimonadota bacterium]
MGPDRPVGQQPLPLGPIEEVCHGAFVIIGSGDSRACAGENTGVSAENKS